MSKQQPVVRTVKLADINTDLFVRKELDWDWIAELAEILGGGGKFHTLMKVTPDLRLIEGRHRKEAFEINNVAEVECEFVDVASRIEFIAEAFRSNVGGAKPPTQADIAHTVELLLAEGVAKRQIAEILPGLPPSMVRKYIADVQRQMERSKLTRAMSAVTDGGLTVAKAAEQYGVDSEKLREYLGGARKKTKQGLAEFRRALSLSFKSSSQKNAAALRKIIEKFEDGDFTEKQARELFAHMEHLQKVATRKTVDWKKRFLAKAESKKTE